MQDCSSAIVTHSWQSTEKPSYYVFAYSYSKAHNPKADTVRYSWAFGGMFGSLFPPYAIQKSELVFAGRSGWVQMHALLLGRVTEDSEGSDWVMKHLSNLLHREKAATQEGKDVWGEKTGQKKNKWESDQAV